MHVDLDYFYAQCEENLNPSIRKKPVVVCVFSGRTESSGVVSTCNYETRKYGVRAGIPIVRAKKLLENVDAVYLPMNRPYYEQVSDRIMKLLKLYGDFYEKAGIDEAFLDLSIRTNGEIEKAREIAHEIKQQLLKQEHITCSIGIGPNKLLAKIGSDHQKPDGLTIINTEWINVFLGPLAVNKIPGVGKKVEERLTQLAVKTIGELSAVDTATLIQTFGKNLGTYLYRAARGEDEEPVKEREQPTQISRIATLKSNTRDVLEILPFLAELAKSVATKLSEKGMACKSIGIIAILDNLSIHSKSKRLDSPTCDEETILRVSEDLMEDFLQPTPSVILRRVGVRLSELSVRSGQTDISRFLQA